MLLHRTSINAERLVFAFDEDQRARIRVELISDASKLEQTHYALMAMEDAERVGVIEDLRMIYEDPPWLLDSEMRSYVLHVRTLVDFEPAELNFENPHFAYIRHPATVDKLRDGLEAAT